jgi:hypothetical protein
MTELETERDVLEERFAFGKINEEMFRKFQSKIEAEISKLRGKDGSAPIEISDRQSQQPFSSNRSVINEFRRW